MTVKNRYTRAVNKTVVKLQRANEKAAKSKTPKFLAERDRRKNPSPLAKLYRELGIVEEHLNG